MASFLQSSPILSFSSSTPSHSSSSLAYFRSRHLVSHVSYPRNTHYKTNLVRRWVTSKVSVPDPTPPTSPKSELTASLKRKLLSVVSRLNRGFAANEDDLQKVNAAAKEIECVGGPVDLSVHLHKMQGKWKLIYNSAFSSCTLEGSCYGRPTETRLPVTVGQVFQRIDIVSKDFENIVELKMPIPQLTDQPSEIIATFAHKFELKGCSKVKIIYDPNKSGENVSQVPLQILDKLKPPSKTGSSEFEVTYLDADTRITRGDKGELLVFKL